MKSVLILGLTNEITEGVTNVIEDSGSIVTIDALGCQTEIVELIVEQEADYVILGIQRGTDWQ